MAENTEEDLKVEVLAILMADDSGEGYGVEEDIANALVDRAWPNLTELDLDADELAEKIYSTDAWWPDDVS